MSDSSSSIHIKETVYVVAALVVVIAGIKSSASIINPFLLSFFIAIICAPLMKWQTRHGVPAVVAVSVTLILLMVIGLGLISFIGSTINAFYQDMPVYEQKLQALMKSSVVWLNAQGIEVKLDTLREIVNPKIVMQMVASVFNSLGSMLANVFLILFMVIFILLEASGFPNKVKRAFGEKTRALFHFDAFADTVQQYLLLKTLLSIANGIIIGVGLVIMGVDYWPLWALTSFLLNYIPNIGSIIAAVPAILIALVQLGFGEALIVLGIYIGVNTLIGNIVEPKLMGRSLGLSSLVVFVTLIFWGWILGPVGMLLSIPLTIIAKIALDNSKKTKWLGTLLEQ